MLIMLALLCMIPTIAVLTPSTLGTVSKEKFIKGIQSLPYKIQMGPPSLQQDVSANEIPSDSALQQLWNRIARSADSSDLMEINELQVKSSLIFLQVFRIVKHNTGTFSLCDTLYKT